jgi:microcystin-dependent protein
MTEPFIGEIKINSFNFPPKGWAFCNGQLLPINQNQALFSLLGTTYGGNGQTNFALPNLQGRAPLHMGNGFIQGQLGGEMGHTLSINEVTTHSHFVQATNNAAASDDATNNVLAQAGMNLYYAPLSSTATMATGALGNQGGSQPHENMQPYLVLSFCIALVGIFPSQN